MATPWGLHGPHAEADGRRVDARSENGGRDKPELDDHYARSTRHGRPVVAVIDDEEDILTYLRLALEDQGFDVVVTPDAEQAMAMISDARPDLICLDLLMPRHTGISLYAKIVAAPELRDVPIVIMSGLAVRSELPDMLKRAGNLPPPSSFIDKPIDIDELVRTFNALLGRPVGVES